MRILLVASAMALAFVGAARASDVRPACMQDMKALCAGVTPGGGRIRDCMRAHRAAVSDTCKIAIADRMLAREHQVGPAR